MNIKLAITAAQILTKFADNRDHFYQKKSAKSALGCLDE